MPLPRISPAALASVPPELRDYIARIAIAEQRSVLPLPYWSKVRFRSVRAGGGPFTYTIDTTPRRAFAYAIGGDLGQAGFAPGTTATAAETNLLKSSETLDNADFIITGMGIHRMPTSAEPQLAAHVISDVLVELSLSGTQNFRMGTIDMYPGPGGLLGEQRSAVVGGSVLDATGTKEGFLVNGYPHAGDYKRFSGFRNPNTQEPFFRWNAAGSSQKDTSLVITLTPQRVMVATGNDRAAIAAIAATTSVGQPAFAAASAEDPPFEEYRIQLIGVSLGPRSNNT